MRLVVATDPGTVEINYTWLPTWIGLNAQLLRRMADRIRPFARDRVLDDATLEALETSLIRMLCEEFPHVKGLDALLRGVCHVSIED